METTNKNLEYPEITNSWVLLSTDENPKVSEETQKITKENLATAKNEDASEELKAPLFETVVRNASDANNKSDAESDSISIISESEFYLSRSDDECSTNSSDENLVDTFKNVELLIHSNVDELPELLRNPTEMETLPNISYSNNKNDDISLRDITEGYIPNDSNKISKAEPESDKNDSEPTRHEGKLIKKELIDYLKTIFKYNSMYFFGTLILALTVSYISSILTQDGSFNQKNMQIDEQIELSNDKIVNPHIHEYEGDIYECTSFNHDYTDEQCMKKPTKDIKQAKKVKPPETKFYNLDRLKNIDSIIQETEIYSDRYNKEDMKCKNKKKCKYNKNSESFQKPDKNGRKYHNQKKYSEITEEKLLQEKENMKNWHNSLAKEEERLKQWEKKLLKMEEKLNKDKKNQDNLNGNIENKKKYKKVKNKDKANKLDETDISFQDKKYFKKNRSGGQKMYVPINSQNQKPTRMKDKDDGYKKKIPVTDDVKMKKFGDVYKQKKNQSAILDDNNTITGEWYLNLIKGRNEKREKGDKAGWWFERANFRKIKRNKAYWYFQYMFNREDLRYISSQNTRNV